MIGARPMPPHAGPRRPSAAHRQYQDRKPEKSTFFGIETIFTFSLVSVRANVRNPTQIS